MSPFTGQSNRFTYEKVRLSPLVNRFSSLGPFSSRFSRKQGHQTQKSTIFITSLFWFFAFFLFFQPLTFSSRFLQLPLGSRGIKIRPPRKQGHMPCSFPDRIWVQGRFLPANRDVKLRNRPFSPRHSFGFLLFSFYFQPLAFSFRFLQLPPGSRDIKIRPPRKQGHMPCSYPDRVGVCVSISP